MQCQHCHSELNSGALTCGHCGAVQRRRFIFEPAREEFALKSEEPFEIGEFGQGEEWKLPPDVKQQFAARTVASIFTSPETQVRWGGFFRRTSAFLIDCFIVTMFSMAMVIMAYVGYKVGLAAYDRSVTVANVVPLATVLTVAILALATGYFVFFHGMEGQTIGKWLLNLRVIGAENERISYARACLRWCATIFFAPLLLGFLWVLVSREKRAWHDYVARTWVIRE